MGLQLYLSTLLALVFVVFHPVSGFSIHRQQQPQRLQQQQQQKQKQHDISMAMSSSPSEDDYDTASSIHHDTSPCNRRSALLRTSAAAMMALGGSGIITPSPSHASYVDSNVLKVTSRVYVDVQVPNKNNEYDTTSRIIIGLFGEAMPRTVANFEKLCQENAYAGTTFYRVLSDMTVQGGAIGDDTGKTGQSSSLEKGNPFEPDNFNILHNKAGLVSMVRGIGGGVDSRFFVNTGNDGGWADDRYAAFGIVDQSDSTSMETVKKIEKVKVKPPQNRPVTPVKIVASGVLE